MGLKQKCSGINLLFCRLKNIGIVQALLTTVIFINDFKLLNPLEAYVLLPEAEVAIGKIKSEIQATPKNMQPIFIAKPNEEKILLNPANKIKEKKKKSKTNQLELEENII